MPAAPSSLTDPGIGRLLNPAHALSGQRARLLPMLAAVPGPRARRGAMFATLLDRIGLAGAKRS